MAEIKNQFIIVNGLALGEETKGNTVQSLVRELNAHTVWRSGGWQGGHHIIHDDGTEIAFSFYGAGTFDQARTYLNHMVISPVELFQEGVELEGKGIPNSLELISVDQRCLSTTPFHRAISRIREMLRGENKKGTVGLGVGEAIRDSQISDLTIRAGEFKDRSSVRYKTENIRRDKLNQARSLIENHTGKIPEEVFNEIRILEDTSLVSSIVEASYYLAYLVAITDEAYLDKLLTQPGTIINEVSHGALHHPWYGFVPHVTQIDPTSQDVLTTLQNQKYQGKLSRIGVVRSYFTRHGAGPLVTYSPKLTKELVETHNDQGHDWLGPFRTGYFDIVALNYVLDFAQRNKFHGLALSFMDLLKTRNTWQVCEGYQYNGNLADLTDHFEIDEGRIVQIKVHPNTQNRDHYEHQRRLTALLQRCQPILTTLRSGFGESLEDVFIKYVEDKLGLPVVATAYGPKISNRKFLHSWYELIKS